MSNSKLESKLAPGRPPRTHGGYAFLTSGKLPEQRAHLIRYLSNVRAGLIHDLGGSEENLSTQQIILIDRIISILGVVRCIEEHAKEYGVMERGGKLSPSLGQHYISFNNTLRLTLQLLGIDRAEPKVLSPIEIIEGERKSSAATGHQGSKGKGRPKSNVKRRLQRL
jgi:hypothetical protein